MKLTSKWLLWFVLVTVYASVIGGLFYYNLFKFVFDKKLQNEMVEMVRFRAPTLVQWLASRPKGEATFREAEIMKGLQRNDDRIKSLVYLNYDGSIRWHENTKFLRMSYADYNNSVGFDTNAVVQAIRDGLPRAILAGNGDYYDMAIPLLAKGNTVAGVVNVTVSRENAKNLIHSSMVRYAIGAFIMILLIGGVLYLFLLLKILRPLESLRDSVDAVSLNNLKLSFPPRQDEIGEVATAIGGLLAKIQEDIKSLEYVAKELAKIMPKNPYYYDPEILSPNSTKEIVKEMIRESCFENLSDELPYESDVVINVYKEKATLDYIKASIIVQIVYSWVCCFPVDNPASIE